MKFMIEVNRYEYQRIEHVPPQGALLDAMLVHGARCINDAWVVDMGDLETLAAFCAATGGDVDVVERKIEIVI